MNKTKLYVLAGLCYAVVLAAWLFWDMKGNPLLASDKTRFAEAKTYLAENVSALPAAFRLILFQK